MIQIDIEMPDKCTHCPCASVGIYGLICGLDMGLRMYIPDYERPLECPLKEVGDEHESALIGSGMYRTPFMCQCIKDNCVAYDNGNCKQFNQNVLKEDEHENNS